MEVIDLQGAIVGRLVKRPVTEVRAGAVRVVARHDLRRGFVPWWHCYHRRRIMPR